MVNRKIRMGMIGGGPDSFIGSVHRIAAAMDGQIELVCGAFSSNPAKSKISGEQLYLAPHRVYEDYQSMIANEALLPISEKMDFVAIVTPNHLHFEPAKLAMQSGFHVVCDKPISFNLAEALELEKIQQSTGKLFALTHTYTGYPMVKEAKHLIKTGVLGKVRKVIVEYPQSWLATKIEDTGHKQADWRIDPTKSGSSCCMADIGTHAQNLAEYITGLKITEVAADLSTFINGRTLDDDGSVLLRFENGAKGVLMATQISTGEENNLKIRVHGEKAGIEWQQEDCNSLRIKWLDKPIEILRTAGYRTSEVVKHNTRLPAGHPEGYLEAFANIYRNFALALQAIMNGQEPTELMLDFPTVYDGVRGMKFIDATVASSQQNAKWVAVQ